MTDPDERADDRSADGSSDGSDSSRAADAGRPGEPTPPVTGEPAVDAAIDRLAALDDHPVADHVAIFDDTHRQLQDALTDLDEG
jgi:hypothetical protein